MDVNENASPMTTIEWSMMNKNRFLALSVVNSLALRSLLYPLTVIKTRLQVQVHNSLYKGTFDAFVKIVKNEGLRGLYRGFMVNTVQVVSGIGYIITYEKVRDLLTNYAHITDNRIKGLIGGGCGSLVGQTIITPFDVISQHMMIASKSSTKNGLPMKNKFPHLDNPLNISKKEMQKYGFAFAIVRELYRTDGLLSFYKGYFASLCTYVPSSALWWMFYPIYSEILANIFPKSTSHMFIHCVAGTICGATVAFITNPFDVLRANIQIQRLPSFSMAIKKLWKEERYQVFYKGVSARVTQSSLSSSMVVIGYETMKRLAIEDEHKDKIRW